jgi:hypothetical protein
VTILTGWTLERARMILPKLIATSGSEDRAVRLLKGTSNEKFKPAQDAAPRAAHKCPPVSVKVTRWPR